MIQAKCTTCGAGLTVKQGVKTCACEYCQSTNIVENALALGKVEVDVTKDIKRLRENLATFVQQNSIDEILRVSQKLLDWIPQDFVALYFFAYVKRQKDNQPRFMYEFLKNPPSHTEEEWNIVKSHLFEYSELRDKERVLQFLDDLERERVDYLQKYTIRQAAEEYYANIPRDVFICFSSRNQDIAHEVVNTIESDGYTCWISTRNLRPNDAENYWNNIENAIEKASLFIVISSEEAMRSKDVQKEIELAIKFEKKRFEIKVDSSNRTSLFKYAFNGVKWIDYSSAQFSKLLKNRIFEELHADSVSYTSNISSKNNSVPNRFDKSRRFFIAFSFIFFTMIILLGLYGINFSNDDITKSSNELEIPLEVVSEKLDNSLPVDPEPEESAVIDDPQIDTIPPTIELIGLDSITLPFGSEFIEPGFVVTDNLDENVEVAVSGLIDSNKAGQYEVIYSAKDEAGNLSVVKRTVIVEEFIELVAAVYAGGNNSYAVTNTNRVFAWGTNLNATMGYNQSSNSTVPVEITDSFHNGTSNLIANGVLDLQVGHDYALLLNGDNQLLYWGVEFGNGSPTFQRTPRLLNLQDDDGRELLFSSFSANNRNATILRVFVGITVDNRVILYGNYVDHDEYVPIGTSRNSINVPIDITHTFDFADSRPKLISYQSNNGFLVSEKNEIYSWGNRRYFFNPELGYFRVNFYHDKLPGTGLITDMINLPAKEEITRIDSGENFTLFLTNANRLFVFGRNVYGEVLSNDVGVLGPVLVNNQLFLNPGEIIVDFSAGRNFANLITDNNRVFTWGFGAQGQIGNGNETSRNYQVIEITDQFNLNEDEDFVSIKSGTSHSILLTSYGRVFTWGANFSGQIGDGTINNAAIPRDITGFINLD